jgi:5-(carboxyamino)imidazole ribonucleotide synthase
MTMILPPATLGVLGGGQLGRYFVLAAHELGYRVALLDPDPHSVAGRVADEHLIAAYDDPAALRHMSQICAAVTTEFESVPATALSFLETLVPVRPGAAAVAVCQDRRTEKAFLEGCGFPLAKYAVILTEHDVRQADSGLFPGILKVSRFGYDGKSQARVANQEEAVAAFHRFGQAPCVLERQLKLDSELSIVVARNAAGESSVFPAAENRHHDGILDFSMVPCDSALNRFVESAREIADGIARQLDYIGVLGIEFFIAEGRIYVNELAPRPHNSAHFTLDAGVTSQFEQQVRTLCGLPLGKADADRAAVMVNLLGDLWFSDGLPQCLEPAWAQVLCVPGLRLHLYGKDQPRPGRKMGHFTVCASTREEAMELAMAARSAIKAGDATRSRNYGNP